MRIGAAEPAGPRPGGCGVRDSGGWAGAVASCRRESIQRHSRDERTTRGENSRNEYRHMSHIQHMMMMSWLQTKKKAGPVLNPE